MIELSAQGGYQTVSVAQVSSHAGVSSATFYELFDGKEDCLLAAYGAAADRLFAHMRPLQGAGDWSETARGVIGGLLKGLESDPKAGRVLLIDVLTGGPRLRRELQRVRWGVRTPSGRLSGERPGGSDHARPHRHGARRSGAQHLQPASAHAHRGSPADGRSTTCSHGWAPTRYPRDARAGAPGPGAAAGRLDRRPQAADGPPSVLRRVFPAVGTGCPRGVVARSQRTRIIYGTAEVMMAKGYANATVTDIVAAAGVARDVFYEHFTDKQHAFLEAQQHPTQYILDACSAAYFSVEGWPARMWSYLQTLLQLIASNPALSHLRLVECYAAGPAAMRRAEEITRSFTIFLEEGYT